ncbi:hypothetical protein [Roseovarius nanhaiticus]|uniref:hypothetical protein n=1 Tax=Roseovarius nanhaiticus TaxID=573024 RepID=UPI0024913A06|nr:hypothetical protein [Roseovarius nanhaiticus]
MPYQLFLSGLDTLSEPKTPPPGHDLRNFPHVPRRALSANAKWIGRAGELLVESVLLRIGLVSAQLPEFMPADCIVYHPDAVLSVQIKTCSKPRDGAFHFNISKGYHRSPTGVRRYDRGDYDLLALVALSENVVKFTADRGQSQSFQCCETATLRAYPRRSLDTALEGIGLAACAALPANNTPVQY